MASKLAEPPRDLAQRRRRFIRKVPDDLNELSVSARFRQSNARALEFFERNNKLIQAATMFTSRNRLPLGRPPEYALSSSTPIFEYDKVSWKVLRLWAEALLIPDFRWMATIDVR